MKKSACIEMMFTEVPFMQRFRLAKEAGFSYIEFETWDDKDINAIKKQCAQHSLKIAAISGGRSLSHTYSMIYSSKKYIEYVKKSLDTAVYLGCSNLVVLSNAIVKDEIKNTGSTFTGKDDIADSEKFIRIYDTLQSLAPFAEKAKVTLQLEALNSKVNYGGYFLNHTKDAASIVKAVDSAYVRLLYDIYHMQIMEGNIIETLKKYIEHIGYIHYADVPGRHEPYSGELNYEKIIEALKDLKYDKIIGFEVIPSTNTKQAVKQIMRF